MTDHIAKLLEKGREVESKALQAPWWSDKDRDLGIFVATSRAVDFRQSLVAQQVGSEGTAKLIAFTRNNWLALLDIVEEQTKALKVIERDGSTKRGSPVNFSAIKASNALTDCMEIASRVFTSETSLKEGEK